MVLLLVTVVSRTKISEVFHSTSDGSTNVLQGLNCIILQGQAFRWGKEMQREIQKQTNTEW